MKQRLKNWIIASASGAIFLGAGIGLYFGIRPSSGAFSDDVKLRFESDSPKGMDALDLSSLSKDDSARIKEADKVFLADGGVNAYYFHLNSYDGAYGSLEFSIGVKDSTVAYYHYIDSGSADDRGAGQAEENEGKRFIGYTLGGDDVMAGATTEETYGDRKKAVDAALTFLKGRE